MALCKLLGSLVVMVVVVMNDLLLDHMMDNVVNDLRLGRHRVDSWLCCGRWLGNQLRPDSWLHLSSCWLLLWLDRRNKRLKNGRQIEGRLLGLLKLRI